MNKKTNLAILLAGLLLAPLRPAHAYQPDYAQDVEFQGKPAPVDQVTGQSIGQYGAGQTSSQIDNYVNQDEQLNLDQNSGTIRVLRTNQKDQINNYVTAFIPLQNVFVRELRGLARTICRKEGGDADVLNDPVRHRNGVVVVCPPHLVPYITRTLQALDHDWIKEYNDGSWYVYYKGKNRDVRNILQILRFYRTPDASWEFDDANNAFVFFDQPCIEPLFQKGVKEIDIPPSQLLLDVAVYELDTQNDLAIGFDWESWKNGPGRNLFELVSWNFGGDFRNELFPGNAPVGVSDWGCFRSYNVFLTTAYIDFLQNKGKARLVTKSTITAKSGTVGELAAVDQVLGFSTTPGAERLLPPMSALVRLTDIWEFYYKNGEVPISVDQLVSLPGTDAVTQIHDFLNYKLTGVDSGASFSSIIASLNDRIKDGVLTRDELEEVPVPMALTLRVFRDRTLRYTNQGQAGVLLTAYPVVGLESAEVAMALDVSDVTGLTPSGTPIIEHRYISSEVQLKDGQPFVLGGLKRSTTVQTGSGIPYLRDIPVLGYAFGREVTTKREKEMVVLVTPRFKLCPLDEPNPPKELQTVANLAKAPVEDKAKLIQVPKDAFGFDQWLLDPIATKRMDAQ